MPARDPKTFPELAEIARQIRRDVVTMTHVANSGHPGGPLSAADYLTYLFFNELHLDPKEPLHADRDRFILSNGHCSAVLYALLAHRGFIPRNKLGTFRDTGSDLQGHPNRHYVPGVEVGTGSLGQGLSVGVGMALALRRDRLKKFAPTGRHLVPRVWVNVGDGELQEGQNWEAAMAAGHYGLDNLTVLVDKNEAQIDGWTHDVMSIDPLGDKFRAFGWNVVEAWGHDFQEIHVALHRSKLYNGKPSVVIFQTRMMRGCPSFEAEPGWHGKPMTDREKHLAVALRELGFEGPRAIDESIATIGGPQQHPVASVQQRLKARFPAWELTRQGLSDELVALGKDDPRVVVLDADLAESTLTKKFGEHYPDRFFDMGIAENNMVNTAAGMSLTGKVPFVASYSMFLAGRSWDQIRNTVAYSRCNVKIAACHGGISVGKDGPTHQSVEDVSNMRSITNMVVIVPADYWQARRAVRWAAQHDGPVFLRFGREKVPTLTSETTPFEVGKALVLREGTDGTIVANGMMAAPALLAAERLKQEDGLEVRVLCMHTVKPLDEAAVLAAARETGFLVTAEEGSTTGGLGAAVAAVVVQSPTPVPVRLVGTPDKYLGSGDPFALFEKAHLTDVDLMATVRALVAPTRGTATRR
ncbi:MAG: transketolase [Planctomycetes bacterium]|nr:transketolase [Planctomycetota bacterium]